MRLKVIDLECHPLLLPCDACLLRASQRAAWSPNIRHATSSAVVWVGAGTPPSSSSGAYRRWQGRAAAALAIANIFYGLINVQNVGTGGVAAYTAVFSVIAGSAILLDGCGFGCCRLVTTGNCPACKGCVSLSSHSSLARLPCWAGEGWLCCLLPPLPHTCQSAAWLDD